MKLTEILKDNVNEQMVITESRNDWMAKHGNTNIWLKGFKKLSPLLMQSKKKMSHADYEEKLAYDLYDKLGKVATAWGKKAHGQTPKEIIVKWK